MRIVIGTCGQDMYDRLAPLAREDAKNGWSLKIFLGALGTSLDGPLDIVSDNVDDEPGWSSILDLTRCPEEGLPWLGQMAGVKVNPTLSDTIKRAQIAGLGSWARGSIPSLVAAAQIYLTGTKTVFLREQFPDAYAFTVITFASETPDEAAVLAALQAQKPAGLIMTYVVAEAGSYAEIQALYDKYSDVEAEFDTYDEAMGG